MTRRRLASELRRLRDEARLTIEEVAARLEWSAAKISRIENARVGVLPRDVKFLLRVYGLTEKDPAWDVMLTLATASRTRGWWHQYGDAVPEWFEVYVGLEADAATVSSYDSEFVPGLLQTEAYARAIHGSSVQLTPADIEKRVTVRLARKNILDGDTQLWFVINEAVIARQVGGRPVIREQLAHLIETSRRPNVTLQVLPFDSGSHASMDGSFSILGFPEPSDPQVVYIEYQTGALYLEKPDEVRRYRMMMDHLRAEALSADASAGRIMRTLDELA
ncbi:MAG: helix-turn-helix domain-containing protein [Actinomycetota bacterium]|nr:helix-turn-helix domain-containing protein [Actinomycetota bacterium]